MKFTNSSLLDPESCDIEIVGIPFDDNASFRKGSKNGPDAIRKSSYELETFLWDKKAEISDITYFDHENIDLENYEDLFGILTQYDCKRKIFLGGDHSISFPAIKSVKKSHKDMYVISIDAHTDFRDIYQDNRFSNACVMRRIGEVIGFENLIEIGIRSSSKDEYEFLKDKIDIYDLYMLRKYGLGSFLDKIYDEKVYLSIDIDVLDPALSPGVGNPEPDGLSTYELISMVRSIFERADVVACDLVEVTPQFGDITAFIAARLVFEIINGWNPRC